MRVGIGLWKLMPCLMIVKPSGAAFICAIFSAKPSGL
jgi:hypothetical protein